MTGPLTPPTSAPQLTLPHPVARALGVMFPEWSTPLVTRSAEVLLQCLSDDGYVVAPAPAPSAPQPSTTPQPCARCAVLEDLLETAVSERDKARDESAKADDEAREHKVSDLRQRMISARQDYALVKEFQSRALAAEAALAAASAPAPSPSRARPARGKRKPSPLGKDPGS